MKKIGILFTLFFAVTACSTPQEQGQQQSQTAVDSIQQDSIEEAQAVIQVQMEEEKETLAVADSIEAIMAAIRDRQPTELAKYIDFPIAQPYPLKDIMNEQELLAAFDRVIPSSASEQMKHATLEDWSPMGWRGLMYQNGQIWLTDDGRISSLQFSSEAEQQEIAQLNDRERHLLGIASPDFVSELCYLAKDSSLLIHIGQDTSGGNTTRMEGYQIRVLYRGDPLTQPHISAQGKKVLEGSCGNTYYTAQIDSTMIIVENLQCAYEQDICPHSCIIGVAKPDAELDTYLIENEAPQTNMQPVYLRDIVKWW